MESLKYMKAQTILVKLILPFALGTLIYSCGPEKQADLPKEPEVTQVKTTPAILYSLVKTYPHDTTSFTEGLLFHDKKLFESTGDVDYLPQTRSGFGIVDLETGKLNVKAEIDKRAYFGEGMLVLNDKIYQLTLDSHIGFIYDAKTFKKIGQFNYATEGWGLTTDGKYIIMSDGSYKLTYLDPVSLSVAKVLEVSENGYAVEKLNELEYIKGYIYANVWMTNTIVKINPATGEVVGKMDLSDLNSEVKRKYAQSLEMNGIAYDSLTNKVLVTGKMWPSIYEISFPY